MRFFTLGSLATSFLLLAAGCGASVSVEAGSDDESSDPTDPGIHPPAASPTCDFDGADGSVLVVVQDRAVVFVRGDGSRQTVLELPELPVGTSSFEVKSRGGVVGLTAIGYEADGTMVGAAALLEADGTVVFSDAAIPGGAATPFLSEAGDLVFSVGWNDSRLVRRDGTTASFDQVTPLGAPDASGLFPVTLTGSVYALEYGLASPAHGVVSVDLAAATYGALGFDGGLLYFGMIDGVTPVLARQTSAGSETLDAPALDPANGMFLKSASRRGDALLATWASLADGSYVPSDYLLAAGASSTVAIGAPDGLFPFGAAGYTGSVLDDAARPFVVARNGHLGGVFTFANGAWSGVGPTFADVWDISVTTRGGTVVGQATDTPGYFEMEPWQDPPAAQPAPDRHGPSAFVARVDGGVALDFPLEATGVTLSADGGCIAYATADGVATLELDGAEVTSLGAFGDAGTTPVMAWLE